MMRKRHDWQFLTCERTDSQGLEQAPVVAGFGQAAENGNIALIDNIGCEEEMLEN